MFAVKASEVGAAVFRAPFDLPAEWRWIPAGEFRMGSAKDDQYRYDDEKMLETVMTGGFFMLDHPVTNAEFRAFLEATGREDLRDLKRKFTGDLQPAVMVFHEEATAYSKWLGEKIAERMGIQVIGRLPFEEEWEKAAKGPDGDEFISPSTSKQVHFDASATRAVDHPDLSFVVVPGSTTILRVGFCARPIATSTTRSHASSLSAFVPSWFPRTPCLSGRQAESDVDFYSSPACHFRGSGNPLKSWDPRLPHSGMTRSWPMIYRVNYQLRLNGNSRIGCRR